MPTAAGDPVFVDTNVLVYASVISAPSHQPALKAIVDMKKAKTELWISRQILREYLAVLSRPQTFVNPIPISTLVSRVRAFQSWFLIADEGPQVTAHLLSIVAQVPMGGKQIHDANIVATMQAYGVGKLLTHNISDFTRFSALIQVLPLV
jgi:predicted nucleic acid-binding protein